MLQFVLDSIERKRAELLEESSPVRGEPTVPPILIPPTGFRIQWDPSGVEMFVAPVDVLGYRVMGGFSGEPKYRELTRVDYGEIRLTEKRLRYASHQYDERSYPIENVLLVSQTDQIVELRLPKRKRTVHYRFATSEAKTAFIDTLSINIGVPL